MRDSSWKPFIATLLTIVILMAMFFIPRLTVGDKLLRRVNILSDIERVNADGIPLIELHQDALEGITEAVFDSTATVVHHKAFTYELEEGLTPIEDFATGERHEMDKFYEALTEASSRQVRIAYFGDSYIEGDIITADLRNLLQTDFGGEGVGFVDITSLTSGFRTTILTKESGWVPHHANDDKAHAFHKNLQGVNGAYFVPSGTATLQFKGQSRKYGEHLKQWSETTVYFTPGGGMQLLASLNGKDEEMVYQHGGVSNYHEEVHEVKDMHVTEHWNEDSSEISYDTTYTLREVVTTVGEQEMGNLRTKTLAGKTSLFNMTVKDGNGSRFYGVAMDGKTGICLDNMSMRGLNGWYLNDIPEETLRDFARQRPYDLIIIHFGLNVANEKQVDYSAYTRRMAEAIKHLQKAYPYASFLVVGIADREAKAMDGTMKTMKGVKELISYQRKMAADLGIAFWNLYEAMGGEGSLAKMVENKQANMDYTHINFAGGRKLGKLMYESLVPKNMREKK